MNALLKAELLRLVSRRLLIVVLVCMAGLAAFGAAVSADYVRPLTAQDRQSAEADFVMQKADWEETCGEVGSECGDWEAPAGVEEFLRTPQGFGSYAADVLSFGSVIMLLVVAVLAVSLVGAEFTSGNIGTQLLFTPMRGAVFTAKVVAATVGGLLVALAYLGAALAFTAIMFLSLRGAGDMTAGVELPLMLGRFVVLAFLIAVMSAALAMAVGSTLIPLGIFAVVLAGAATLADTLRGFSLVQLFLPSNILFAMVSGRHEVFDYRDVMYEYEAPPMAATVISYDWALGYSVIGTVLIVIISVWAFRRRDILR